MNPSTLDLNPPPVADPGSPVLTEPLDGAVVRADFPILAHEQNGQRLVYLDSAASSQRPNAVLDAMRRYETHSHANVHRGVHRLAAEATDLYERARTRVAAFLGTDDRREVVFTSGTTAAINLVAGSWGQDQLGPGDVILVTPMEHHSNLVPWQLLSRRTGSELRAIPLLPDGTLDLDALPTVLDDRVRFVTMAHVSNTLGVTNPVAEVVAAAHAVGAKVLLDAAQSVPHGPVDVRGLDVDFLAFSGHKMLGPTGIGVLWARHELLEAMPPWQGGGEMIRRVTMEGSTWNDAPYRFEAGTPPIAQAVGLAAAVDYMQGLGMDRIATHHRLLAGDAARRLDALPGLRLLGPAADAAREGVVSFTVDGLHAHDLATILDARGIAVRAGHHCTMPLHDHLGVAASTRASFAVYNTLEDIDDLVEGVKHAQAMFGLNA